MKIIVLHGDNTQESYQRLARFRAEAKQRGWLIKTLLVNSKYDLSEQLTSQSLFQKEVLYILEGAGKLKKRELEWLKSKSGELEATLVIFHPSVLPQAVGMALPEPVKYEKYELPKLIWKFLDSFYPGNSRNSLKFLHNTVETEPLPFVFSQLARHVRDLYMAKLEPKVLSLPAWRVNKLKSQAKKFQKGQLHEIISQLSLIDVKSKTSSSDLLEMLDFTIITGLE